MMQEELTGLDERESQVKDQLDLAERNLQAKQDAVELAETAVAQAAEAVEEAVQRKQSRSQALADLKEELAVAQRRMDAVAAEVGLLESLLASFDDFSESVQFLAGDADWTEDELVTVADVVGCDPGVKPAVEAALGDFASCLVVKTQAEATRAISKLKESEKGRTTFMILDRLPSPGSRGSVPAGTRALIDEVRFEPDYEALVQLLLHDAVVVDDLEAALQASGPGIRCFTEAGEWVRDGGVVHAGSVSGGSRSGGGRLGRREQLETAQSALAQAQSEVEALRKRVTFAQTALAEVLLPEVERQHRACMSEQSTARSTHARAVLERDNLARRNTELAKRRQELSKSLDTFREDIASRSVAVQEAQERVTEWEGERTRHEETFQTLEIDGRAAIGRYSEANITAVQARNHLDNLNRDLSRVQQEIVRLEQERVRRTERLADLEDQRVKAGERIVVLETTIADLHVAKTVVERDVVSAKDALSLVKVSISEIEAEVRVLRRTRDQRVQEENALAVRLAEVQTRTENLVTSTAEEYEIDLETTRIEEPEDFDPEAAPGLVQEIRSKVRGLGPVNELALETFEEEKERLDFLRTQLADLEGAEAILMETITEINTTASDRFDKTFSAIQANFSRLFSDLFGEDANARVVLQDESDPLESDIEIFAKPSGKKPSVLAQLSGGEKTLTAIALLFAIYLVKPSPFCILDEVDAPLDDANVDRFMDLIRSFSESTQFVLVTHNKRTMEAADRMYGITMQQQGVSSLVGVEFNPEVDVDMQLVA
jgi:chromosome segregation protein